MSPANAFGVPFRPCMESGLQVAANDVVEAGVPRCQMSQSWWLVVEVLAKRRANVSVAVVTVFQPLTAEASADSS